MWYYCTVVLGPEEFAVRQRPRTAAHCCPLLTGSDTRQNTNDILRTARANMATGGGGGEKTVPAYKRIIAIAAFTGTNIGLNVFNSWALKKGHVRACHFFALVP